jgi:hypothetical protein
MNESYQPGTPAAPAPLHAAKPAPNPGSGKKRTLTAVLITCGSLLVIGLLLLCLGGGVWYGMSHGAIPALPFMNTPTHTATPTRPSTSTPIPTLTSTPVLWSLNINDDFSANTNNWPLGDDTWSNSNSHLSLQNGKLRWAMDSTDSYMNWLVPDLPSFSDFDAAVDVQRTAGSTSGEYGIILRYDPDTYSFYFFGVKDESQMYEFIVYVGSDLTTITDWTYNSAINSGGVNRLEVIGKGPGFTLLINGTKVGQAEDGSLSSGQMGIMTYLPDPGDQITLEYDNLILQGSK